jgi:hypothetical protein
MPPHARDANAVEGTSTAGRLRRSTALATPLAVKKLPDAAHQRSTSARVAELLDDEAPVTAVIPHTMTGHMRAAGMAANGSSRITQLSRAS